MAAVEPDPKSRVLGLKKIFLRQVSFPSRLLGLSLIGIAACGCALVARLGTGPARFLAAFAFLLFLVVFVTWSVRRRKASQHPSYFLENVLSRLSPSLSARARRAHALFERLRKEPDPTESPQLARLHLSRVLGEVSSKDVEAAGRKVRRNRLGIAFGLLALLLSALILRPLSLLEGVDVLFAHRGVGPFPINYVARLQVTAQFPAYLDGTRQRRYVGAKLAAVPQGSEIEVRVVPVHEDRELLLTDGMSEVPLLSDGKGGLIARWKADDPSELRVAARFGEVLLYDGQSARLTPVDDRPPRAVLMGAPSEHELDTLERLPLSFYALDDHGLSQIDLVVESGQRSVRKELSHLDGTQRVYRGGHTITREHELLKKAFLPIRIRIEARDGNVATGPSWGLSKEIVLLPKPLGKDIAERHVALREFRRALSKYVADLMKSGKLTAREAQAARAEAHAQLVGDFEALSARVEATEGVPRNSISFVRGQIQALEKAGAERAPPQAVLLAVDSLIQRVAFKEAQALAKDLGAAVEELAVQARQLRFGAEEVRVQGVWDLLKGVQIGAEQLHEVGSLGLDLGSVARADLGRITRSLKEERYERAEGAAIHLAERLKRANASFSSKGGAGVESGMPSPGQGGGQAMPGGQGEGASQAPAQFDELAQKLDQLAQDNATELSELERLMQEAARAAERDFQENPKMGESVEELRRALSNLPASGYGPGSPRTEAAQARAEGEAMADALEGGNFREAGERGKNAQAALERARQLAENMPGWLDPSSLTEAQRAVEKALEQAKMADRQLEERAQAEQRKGLSERHAARRALAERAEQLAKEGTNPGAPLPEESVSALERAARLLKQSEQALRAGDMQAGLQYSERAQSELERALPRSDQTGRGGAQGDGELNDDGAQSRHGSVPEEERDRARDFRERVEKGLSRGGGRLSPAVRRYAEELK